MGSSSKQTVGYKYYLGIHMVLCHGPVDSIKRIVVENKTAWEGSTTGGRIVVRKPNLFGGEERGGGVSGDVDIEMGRLTQPQNDYLQAQLGTDIPAFRGVTAAVLRQCYVGNSAYIKPWAFRAQRVLSRTGGASQWNPLNAGILTGVNEIALSIVIDFSIPNDEQEVMVAPIRDLLESLRDSKDFMDIRIQLVAYGAGFNALDFRRTGNSDLAFDQLVDWLDFSVNFNPDWDDAVIAMEDFFVNDAEAINKKHRVCYWFAYQDPRSSIEAATQAAIDSMVAAIPDVTRYVFNVNYANTFWTSQISNTGDVTQTGGDGMFLSDFFGEFVGTEDDSYNDIMNKLMNGTTSAVDMNPAHIIRECLNDAEWGMGYPDSDFSETTFSAAATTLVNEGFGLSLLWDRQTPIEDFVLEVTKHINGVVRVNRQTGLIELKLVRDDYNVNNLIVLDESNIERFNSFSRPDFGELVNSVTVQFYDIRSGTEASITVQDPALAQQQRVVINTTIQYPGISKRSLAIRVAERDLRTLSTPLVNCVLFCNSDAAGLNVGDPFVLSWDDYGINQMVMRVAKIAYGDGVSNKVKLTATQDVYFMPDINSVEFEPEEVAWVPTDVPPQNSNVVLATEAPYWELVQNLSQTQVEAFLEDVPQTGLVMVLSSVPGPNHINADLSTDGGTGTHEVRALMDFCPYGLLDAGIGKFDTTCVLSDEQGYSLAELPAWAYIDQEIVEVTAYNSTTKTLTLKRGVMDTIPATHSAGAGIWLGDNFPGTDSIEYVTSDVVEVAVLPRTSSGVLPLSVAPRYNVTFANRAVRPYRPGNLRVEGQLDDQLTTDYEFPVSYTWSRRNRQTETAPDLTDWTAGDIVPETGTTYEFKVEMLDSNFNAVVTVKTENLAITAVGATIEEADITDNNWYQHPYIRATVTAYREGYESWQSPSIIIKTPVPIDPPTNLTAVYTAP